MSKSKKNAPVTEAVVDLDSLNSLIAGSTAELETSAAEGEAEAAERAKDEELLAQLEAAEKAETEAETAVEPEVVDEPVEHVPGKLAEMIAEVSEGDVLAMSSMVKGALDDRAAAERKKNPDNETIQRSLNKSRSKLAGNGAAAILVATSVDPIFINRSISTGNTYNVYAIDKFADLLVGMQGGVMRNAINIAVMKSMFKFRAAGVEFTGEMARAAASQNIKVSAALNALLTRHTVAPGTAPTQASSTMQALQTAGVVINKGSMKYPVYQLTDTPQTRALQEALAA